MVALAGDFHTHTEWSFDAPGGSMDAACRRALEIGVPAIAFTDHVEFTPDVQEDERIDLADYLQCLNICRERYPKLRILSGVEAGEPHRFPDEMGQILGSESLDWIVGSVHCVFVDDRLVDLSAPGVMNGESAPGLMRSYLSEALTLVRDVPHVDALAHLEYPKWYWPHDESPYSARDYEAEFRLVLAAAARRMLVLEVNTLCADAANLDISLCPGPTVLRWWREEGGRTVSLGSDAHTPDGLAKCFAPTLNLLEELGFPSTESNA